jgi:UDP-2,3-diacylglucosamine pyrophosphatase LpxH
MRDLLLISDLHLGSHLKPLVRGEFVHLAAQVEANFPHFLAHYQERGPWQLVINGDFIDFWNVEGGEAEDTEELAVERLHLVMDAHPAVEEALVRFLEAGHGLVFVTGNHDAELLYPKVRKALASRLEGAVGSDASITRTGMTRIQDLEAGRVRFVPWFLCERGGVWIEHGHLFDAACATPQLLSPTRQGRLVKSVAEVATRRFSNLMPEIDYDAPDSWTGADYVRWATARGLRFVLRVVLLYLRMVGHMLGLWAQGGRVDLDGRKEHERRLGRVAQNAGLQMATLTALQNMAPPPTSASVWGVLSVTQLDYVLSALTGLLLGPVLASILGFSWVWGVPLGLIIGAVATWRVHAIRQPRDVAQDMLEVAASIGELTGVPLVLMGHSHHGSLERSGQVLYGNSGSWLDGSHLVVTRDAENGQLEEVQLRRWRNGGVFVQQRGAVPDPPAVAVDMVGAPMVSPQPHAG